MARIELIELPDPWTATEPSRSSGERWSSLRGIAVPIVGATGPVAALAVDGFHGRALVLALLAVGWALVLRWRPRNAGGFALVLALGAAIPLLTWSGIGRSPAMVMVAAVFVAHAALVGWDPLPGWPTRQVPVAALAMLPLVASQIVWFREERLALVAGLLVLALALVEAYHRAPAALASADRRFAAGLVAIATGIGAVVLLVAVSVLLYLPGLVGGLVDRWRRRRVHPSYWRARGAGTSELAHDALRPFTSAPPRERLARNLVGGAVVVLLVAVVVSLVVDREQASQELAELERSDVFERGQEVRFSELAAFEGVEFADELKEEQDRFSNQYLLPSDVGGYDAADFEGRFTNVRDGVRRSIEPPPCDGCPRVTAWVVGGSSAFGLGQRDEHTIASELVRRAADDGVSLEVVNLAVPGYTIHQEAEKVLARLDAGAAPPDLVLFYNGYNDVLGTVMDSTVNGIRPDEPALMDTEVIRRFTEEELDPWDVGTPDELGDLAAMKYEREALAVAEELDRRGIRAVFVFQPDALASDEQYETVAAIYEIDERLRAHFDGALERAARSLSGRATNLRHLLDGPPPVFADLVHTNEVGASSSADAVHPLLGLPTR